MVVHYFLVRRKRSGGAGFADSVAGNGAGFAGGHSYKMKEFLEISKIGKPCDGCQLYFVYLFFQTFQLLFEEEWWCFLPRGNLGETFCEE